MDPRSWPREILVAIAVVAVLVAATQALAHAWSRWWRRRTILARVRRAGEGEARAADWLAEPGYTVLATQATAAYELTVDGSPVTATVRADYLVERRGARFVAEVKTGNVAPRIDTAATRRQLLEYRVAFDVDGVLLVDAETGRVHEVTFPLAVTTRPSKLTFLVAVALAITAVVLLAR